MLLDPDLLPYALDPGDDDFNRIQGAPLRTTIKIDWFKFNSILSPTDDSNVLPLDEAFEKFKDQTGPLKTEPATTYAEYVCAVPQSKSVAARFLFTLVATLALGQSAWMMFKYVLDRKVTWNDLTANWCERCLEEENNPIALQKSKPSNSFGSRNSRRLLEEDSRLKEERVKYNLLLSSLKRMLGGWHLVRYFYVPVHQIIVLNFAKPSS